MGRMCARCHLTLVGVSLPEAADWVDTPYRSVDGGSQPSGFRSACQPRPNYVVD